MNFEKAKEIYEGFSNLIKHKASFNTETIEKMAKLRFNICKTCKERDVFMNSCRKCGCYIPAKTRSKHSECPLLYWKSI